MKRVGVVLIILALLIGVASASLNRDKQNVDQQIQNAGYQMQNAGVGLINMFENLYRLFMELSLPDSLDKFYVGSKPEVPGSEWVGEMFIQSGAFEGIVLNLQETPPDWANATASYNVFASEYKNISNKVPEWQGYFDIATVDKLGNDLKANSVPAAFQDIGTIGATCGRCHANQQPQVWAKYYWRDFNTVNVSTPTGNLTWPVAMTVLAGSFEGIGVNAAKGNQTKTNNSFNQFVALYTSVKDACSNCHDTPRYYYVSADVFAKIDQMGENITAGNLTNAQANQQELGIQCYKCHVLHMPAQDMKDKMEKTLPGISCPGDLNGDGKINIDDFVMFAAAYGTHLEDTNFNSKADLNHDGKINIDDFVMFAAVYGTSCKA
jgi:cytochrome c553